MGFYRGPNIVTDGLVFAVDAASERSYPGTGTTWATLSGENNATLTNGPSFDSGNGGSFDFDGSDDFCSISGLALSTTAYTKAAWFNPDGATNNIISGGSSDGQHAFWMAATSTSLQSGHDGAWGTVSYSPGVMTGQWWYGVVSFNTTTGWKLYLNGELVDTSNSTTTFTGGTTVRISAYNNASNTFNGKIASVNIYNRVLSDDEVLQNYNAIKNRFGL